ncbi:protein kinase family protein [Paenibacillus sp. CAU 1782]
MIPQIKEFLLGNWKSYFAVKPQSIQLLLLSNPQGKKITHGKITVLIFINENEKPEIVGKFLRIPQTENEKLKNEHYWLQTLNRWGHSPKSLGSMVINGRVVAFEQYVPGISLKLKIQKEINFFGIKEISLILDSIEEDFSKTSQLINDLKNIKVTSGYDRPSYMDNTIENSNYLFSILNISEPEKLFFIDLVEKIKNIDVPRTIVHFDLTPSNVIEHSNKLSIIDFEFSQISRFAFLDAYRFAYYYFYLLHESGVLPYSSLEANFWFFFIKESRTSEIVRGFINSTVNKDNKISFYESMCIFLLSNLQLQLDEVDVVSEEVITQKSALITMLIKINNGLNIDENDFNTIDPYEHFSKEMFVAEMYRYQNTLNEYTITINNKEIELSKNNSYIDLCHKTIANKDQALEQNTLYIQKCHDTIANKEKEIENLISEIEKLNLNYKKRNKIAEKHEKRSVILGEKSVIEKEINKRVFKKLKNRFMSRFKKGDQ